MYHEWGEDEYVWDIVRKPEGQTPLEGPKRRWVHIY
jgi:hypothetical protein